MTLHQKCSIPDPVEVETAGSWAAPMTSQGGKIIKAPSVHQAAQTTLPSTRACIHSVVAARNKGADESLSETRWCGGPLCLSEINRVGCIAKSFPDGLSSGIHLTCGTYGKYRMALFSPKRYIHPRHQSLATPCPEHKVSTPCSGPLTGYLTLPRQAPPLFPSYQDVIHQDLSACRRNYMGDGLGS